jgi:hypothetical protein
MLVLMLVLVLVTWYWCCDYSLRACVKNKT